MANVQKIDMFVQGKDATRCPTCGMAVRIIRRSDVFADGKRVDGMADHYEAMQQSHDAGDEAFRMDQDFGMYGMTAMREVDRHLATVDAKTAAKLREQRAGKKTVAMVGMASTSCNLAPWDEKDVEIWACNEMHYFGWVKRATRWFQIHSSFSYKREIAKRGVRGHYQWLMKNPWDIPIYTQYYDEKIPKSTPYPIRDVTRVLLKNFIRGVNGKKTKYFTSSLAYMMGIALLEGRNDKKDERPFQRVELYGFEMADDIEYVRQKSCAEFWVGLAMGMGVEVYTPEGNQLLLSTLYGGNEQGAGW